jgi:hypothetical protein
MALSCYNMRKHHPDAGGLTACSVAVSFAARIPSARAGAANIEPAG